MSTISLAFARSKFNIPYLNLSLAQINSEIIKTYCHNTCERLKDENLKTEYLNSELIQGSLDTLELVLNSENIGENTIRNIVDKYYPHLLSKEVRDKIKKDKFNILVFNKITSLSIFKDKNYEIKMNTAHPLFYTKEIPNFYIYDKKNHKILMGLNHLDLWSDETQLNQGFKYIMNEELHKSKNVKIIHVVCNFVNVQTKNKTFNLFNVGIKKDRMCYINGLSSIIKDFLNIGK